MRPSYQVVALGCSLPFASAGSFVWNSGAGHDHGSHAPAQQTSGLDKQMLPVPAVPAPTSPPELRRSPLWKRQSSIPGSVCGYMSHDISSALACATDNTCIFTTFGFSWVAGCCPTTSTDCPIATTCVDSAVGLALGSAEIGVSTYWCSVSEYPICVTLTYEDVPGYTIYNCGGLEVDTLQAVDHSLAVSSTAADTTTTSEASSASATSTDGTTSTSASAHSSSKSSTPVGAIVGGAVGGVAVIAIFVFALVFLLCKRRRSSGPAVTSGDPNTPLPPPVVGGVAPAPGTYQQAQPAMQQPYHNAGVQQQPGVGVVDGNHSDQKPPYNINTQSIHSLPSPGSPPPPHSPSPGAVPPYQQSTHSPTPQENQGFKPAEPGFNVSQQNTGTTQTFNEHQQHDTWSYHEMPSTKPDGELRELP